MKHFVIFATLLCASGVFAADKEASCVIADKSILNQTPSSMPTVSNLGLIEVTCRVPGRPWPSDAKPGFSRFALRLKTVAYQIGEDGTRKEVPSMSNVTGGSNCGPPQITGECTEESLLWYLNIPIDSGDAIAQVREFGIKLNAEQPFSPEQRQAFEDSIRNLENNPEELAEMVQQYRPGHFQVECRIMDGDRLWAVGRLELEIVFKGRAYDALLGKPQGR